MLKGTAWFFLVIANALSVLGWWGVFAGDEKALLGVMIFGILDVPLLLLAFICFTIDHSVTSMSAKWWTWIIPLLTIGRTAMLLMLNA